jgi:leucyl aminopeptidase (aminopeptidase T)
MNRLEKAAQLAFFEGLRAQPKQTVLLVAQPKLAPAAHVFRKVAEKERVEVLFLEIPNHNKHPLLSSLTRDLIANVEAVVLLAPYIDAESLHWLRHQSRSRVVVWPQLEEETIARCANVDLKKLRERCRKLADILTIGRNLTVRHENGLALEMSIAQRRGHAEVMPLENEMYCAGLPCGRAFSSTQASTVSGEMLLNGIAGERGFSSQPIQVKVVDGKLTLIKGAKNANIMRRRLRATWTTESSEGATKPSVGRSCVEIGLGLNEHAKLGQSALEDEKVIGTVHLGFGRRSTPARPAEILVRGIVVNPTLIIDGREIVQKGRLTLE